MAGKANALRAQYARRVPADAGTGVQMYLIGQMTELAKLSIAYHLVRKEKWLVNLTQ